LRIEPNPFSPDGDGFEDEVRFEYIIPLKSELTLKIYDVQGRLIKTIFEQQPQASGEMIWDGKSDKQRIVRAGIYVVFLEAKLENKKLVKKATVVAAKR
jgi:flagellar hook assembly protein FlgD